MSSSFAKACAPLVVPKVDKNLILDEVSGSVVLLILKEIFLAGESWIFLR